MYGPLWRALPGPWWVRVLILIAIAVAVAYLCAYFVFPFIEPLVSTPPPATVGD